MTKPRVRPWICREPIVDAGPRACHGHAMPTYDPTQASCRVFTYKEGLLSAVAHDLEIDVTRFSIDVDPAGPKIDARFEPDSFRVLHAMIDGRPAPSALSASDRAKIEGNIEKEVFQTRRRPGPIELRSESIERTDAGYRLHGRLTIAGTTRAITIPIVVRDGVGVAEVVLHQPDFGIKPYSAMLGTLKIQPNVKVVVRCPFAV